MLKFNTADPFPLFECGKYSYAEEKQHSARVDAWLGIKVGQAEARSVEPSGHHQTWLGTPPETFLTPYSEFRRIFSWLSLQPEERVIDLGAGYGRAGFVLSRHFPEVNFLGIELLAERVKEAESALGRFGAGRAKMLQADLSDPNFILPTASIFFIYDFGTRKAIARALLELQRIAEKRGITIVGRGRGVRDQIEREHPWLSQVVAPEHFKNFSFYFSQIEERDRLKRGGF